MLGIHNEVSMAIENKASKTRSTYSQDDVLKQIEILNVADPGESKESGVTTGR
jgi:hypothetical protein